MDRADSPPPAADSRRLWAEALVEMRDWRHIVSSAAPHSPMCEFVRYGLVSGIALAGDVVTLVVLVELFGMHYLAAAALGFSVGILIAYALSVRWAFASRRLASVTAERVIFVAIGLGGLAINHAVMFGLTEIALLPYAISKFGSVGLVFFFNFTLRKLLLFTASPALKG